MNTIGNRFRLTTFGESHGKAVGGIIDGMPAGLLIDEEFVQQELNRRRPGQSDITTSRKEEDKVEFLSGLFEGKTTGTPIAFSVWNTNQHSSDYSDIKDKYRPSHADYTYTMKYGVRDYRGGRYGFFSGHACNTMCMAMFLSWLFRSPKVTFALFFWSITTTFTRLYLGVHYLGDVCVGWTVGAILGFLFYVLMEKVHVRIGSKRLVSEQFTSTGYLKSDMDSFLAVIFFNYICVIIVAMTLGIG